jgi:hypothetical protein
MRLVRPADGFSGQIDSVLDIAGKYLLLILKPSSYLKLNVIQYSMPFRRNLPGSKVT